MCIITMTHVTERQTWMWFKESDSRTQSACKCPSKSIWNVLLVKMDKLYPVSNHNKCICKSSSTTNQPNSIKSARHFEICWLNTNVQMLENVWTHPRCKRLLGFKRRKSIPAKWQTCPKSHMISSTTTTPLCHLKTGTTQTQLVTDRSTLKRHSGHDWSDKLHRFYCANHKFNCIVFTLSQVHVSHRAVSMTMKVTDSVAMITNTAANDTSNPML